MVEDQKIIQRVEKVGGRLQLEERAALPQEFGVIGRNVTGTVGRVTLTQVADAFFRDRHPHQAVQFSRLVQHSEQILSMARQVCDLLLMGQCSVGNGGQNGFSCSLHFRCRKFAHGQFLP